MKRILLFFMIIMTASLLCSCRSQVHPDSIDNPMTMSVAGTDLQVDIADDSTKESSLDNGGEIGDTPMINEFKFHHSGTAMEPYHLIKIKDGWYHVISTLGEEDSQDASNRSDVVVSEEEMKTFSQKLLDLGVLEWDGFSKSKSLGPGVLDGDDGFSLSMTLSDGSKVNASGYNSFPNNYNDIESEIYSFFSSHQDYSDYYPKTFPEDQKLQMIEITIGSPYISPGNHIYKISLSNDWKQWSVKLFDPNGEYLEKGTDISDYAYTDEALPFDTYQDLLEKHDILALNEKSANSDTSMEYLQVFGYFDGDKQISINYPIDAAEYDSFIKEFVEITKDFYDHAPRS